ncbi:MAG: glutamine amidotransferase [Pseudomonadales bacterium]|nr:glutamine amidotransferase [Pseudomonadales bacterium]MBO6703532.1 glutamine amidotransferase [Pseudomonadales bacterium]MBO7004411.1 glutamine amidotransferase [Pseudomonadales bacterium]
MSKPFLVIQLRPEDETATNELEAIRRYGSLSEEEVVRVRAEVAGLPELDLNHYSAVIVGGSPFDVSAENKLAIQRQIERDFFRLFDEIKKRDFPFLGCCSGNGLLGHYCGAVISKKYGEPVGGVFVSLTDDGKADPLLEGFPKDFRVLLGHKEACDDVPPETTLLVRGEDCPVQMFRLKQNIYATQFHPEGDIAGFTLRINVYRKHGYFPPEEADSLIRSLQGERVAHSNLILKRFVERYRS